MKDKPAFTLDKKESHSMRQLRKCFCASLLLSLLMISSAQGQSMDEYLPDSEDNVFTSFDGEADERMRRVVKILRTSDKAQVNQFVPVAFELENVNPFAVVRFIRRVIEVEEGNWWTFVSPEGDSGVVVVNVPTWQVEPMRELMSLIDRPGLTSSSGSQRVYVALNHRDPADISNVVINYMTGSAVIIPDLATGSLYLEDAPSGVVYALDRIAGELDFPTAQIVLRAKVYEIDLTNDGTIGADFHAWKNGPGRNLFAIGGFGEYYKLKKLRGGEGPIVNPGFDANGLPGRRITNSGFNAAYYYDVPSEYFDFLVSKGRARIMTAPSATVLSTEAASFFTGEEILYYEVASINNDGTRNEPLDPMGNDPDFPDNRTLTGKTISRGDVGVSLSMLPIIAEDQVELSVDISVTSQLGYDQFGVPMLSTSDLSTDVRAAPGQEYVIGGMTRTRSIQTTRKIPVLGSLPVLGYLFGGEITTAKQTMLMVVVSADLVDDYSGMNSEELMVVQNVEQSGMNQIALPEEIFGFDMMLIGDVSSDR